MAIGKESLVWGRDVNAALDVTYCKTIENVSVGGPAEEQMREQQPPEGGCQRRGVCAVQGQEGSNGMGGARVFTVVKKGPIQRWPMEDSQESGL